MFRDVFPELEVELYQSVHCNRDRDTFEAHDPNMCERRIERILAVMSPMFRDYGDDREQDPNEAILKDTDVDNLRNYGQPRKRVDGKIQPTLNQVRPLLGFLNIPVLSLPGVMYCNQDIGQIQFFGVVRRKKSFCS